MTCIVAVPEDGVVTIGADSAGVAGLAMGALHAIGDGLDARRRVEKALEAAAAMSAGVRGPFVFLRVSPVRKATDPRRALPRRAT